MPLTFKDLRQGDVVLHIASDRSVSFGGRGVWVVTGNSCVHCGLVVFTDTVIEQSFTRRVHHPASEVYKSILKSESLRVVRPRFPVTLDLSLVTVGNFYGVWTILDLLINHGMGWVFKSWTYRPWLTSLFGGRVCSSLVAGILMVDKHAEWCHDTRVVEPDDFVNHPESFEDLGVLEL